MQESKNEQRARPAFAALGGLLDEAEPVGRVDVGNDKLWGYLFRTTINGVELETLVAWSETNPTTVDINGAKQMYDYLGASFRKLSEWNSHGRPCSW